MNNKKALRKRGFFIYTFAPVKLKPAYFIPSVLWFITANILMLMPGNDIPHVGFLDEIYFDKWVHIGLFSGLTFLIAYPFTRANRSTKKLLIIISIGCIIYGVLIEFIQKYFAFERSFDITDMIADAAGCLLGYLGASWFLQRVMAKNKPL